MTRSNLGRSRLYCPNANIALMANAPAHCSLDFLSIKEDISIAADRNLIQKVCKYLSI
jgi:hypothetical protein